MNIIKRKIWFALLAGVGLTAIAYAQYASPDPNSPFYDSQGNQISIGQAMDQGGTVRIQEALVKKPKVNTAKLFDDGWKLLREIVPKECKDCSEWHKNKERKLNTCLKLYQECLKTQDEMWDAMHDALDIKYLTLLIAGMSWLPGTASVVEAGFGGVTPKDARDVAVDKVEEELDQAKKYVDKKINNYKKIRHANKYEKTIKNANRLNNVGKAIPFVSAGITTAEYGCAMKEWEDKIKKIEEGNKAMLEAIRKLQESRCPECGGL